jgi:hypothetical protein
MHPLKARRLVGGATLLVSLLTAGCNAVPMTYSQWKQEQEQRAKFAEAGIAYKSPSELRGEAEEMRRIAQDTTFAPGR